MAKSDSVSAARLTAFEILLRVEEGAFASILLAAKEPGLSVSDRALTHELVLGVLRRQLWLDTVLGHFSDRKLSSLDPAVRIALRLGLYQLRFLSRIPPSAAVNESVKLIRRSRLRSAEGFVNAILRRATREPRYDPVAEVSEPLARLSIETSHPTWLLQRWVEQFGFVHTSEFARSNSDVPSLAFRVVHSRATEDEIRAMLSPQAHMVESKIAANAFRLAGSASGLFELAAAGKVYIQDESSQLVGELLNGRPGESILDLCAAPGSKTTQIADLAGDKAKVLASDRYEARLRTIEQTSGLHQLKSIQMVLLNALDPLPFPQNHFDAVLVDAPCSGTGTLRRNPEIRWRISAADVHELSSRQKKLISNVAGVIRPGGRLVYSTCSVEREENEEVVSDFLKSHPEFETVNVRLSEFVQGSLNGVRTWPNRGGADGFYVAVMKKKSNC